MATSSCSDCGEWYHSLVIQTPVAAAREAYVSVRLLLLHKERRSTFSDYLVP